MRNGATPLTMLRMPTLFTDSRSPRPQLIERQADRWRSSRVISRGRYVEIQQDNVCVRIRWKFNSRTAFVEHAGKGKQRDPLHPAHRQSAHAGHGRSATV